MFDLYSNSHRPLIVEPNFEVILEVGSPRFKEVQGQISTFCSLVKSPSYFFTYIIDTVSLWNGFSLGMDDQNMIAIMEKYSRYPLPENICNFIKEKFQNFGIFSLENYDAKNYRLIYKKKNIPKSSPVFHHKSLVGIFQSKGEDLLVPMELKCILKNEMAHLGYIVKDFTNFCDGDPIYITLASSFHLREYQKDAVSSFLNQTIIDRGGAGTVIMPCGSGKTMVGIGIMAELSTSTLIITPNLISLRQWKQELLEKTNLREEDIGEYSSLEKVLKPITLTTYQIISYREVGKKQFKHLNLFTQKNWGLVIYDEIHMLPANIFRYTTGIESKRRLGLTATLIREDGREKEVFSLVGPKKYDLPWKELEKINFIAQVNCFEIKVGMSPIMERNYFTTMSERDRYRIAAENSDKFFWVEKILERFSGFSIIIIGQFIDQLQNIYKFLNRQKNYGKVPLLTGKTQQLERLDIYEKFKNNEIKILLVSRIANFAVDLPNADVAIQISGTFGSRQEETQRLGRIVRPKNYLKRYGDNNQFNQSFFFSLVTKNTKEEILAQNRKGFLVNQGYHYETITSEEMLNSTLKEFLKELFFSG